MDPSQIQSNYAENVAVYSQFASLPLGQLEQQLFSLCIRELSAQHKVLDLGGGTGARARDALRAGATHVDVVDISREMMALGQKLEASLGRSNAITWYYGDVSKSLADLGLEPESYDLVISNGTFDHAQNDQELEMMWKNCATYLKPGGRVLANRNNPRSKAARLGKYGVRLGEFEEVPGGFKYRYRMLTEPEVEFESRALDSYFTGSMDIPGKFFEAFRNIECQETDLVKRDETFWREYLEDPILFIFEARKKA